MKKEMQSKLLVFPLALLLVIGLIVAICAPALAAEKPKPKGTLVFATDSLYEEMFLPWRGGVGQDRFWEVTYDYLFWCDEKTGDPIPSLGKRWEYSKDFRSITIFLRKGVPWHGNWGEVTAEDVKFTIEKITMKTSTNTLGRAMGKEIESMEVVDQHTLALHLKKPNPMFWLMLVNHANPWLPIVCKKYVETVGEDKAAKEPIASGPYRLVEHKWGDFLKFEAREDHFMVVPEFKYITLRAVPETSTRVAMLTTKEIDIAPVSNDNIARLEAAGISIRINPGGYLISYNFGGILAPKDPRYVEDYHNKDPWADKRVREAMSIAIDRNAIVKTIYLGGGRPVTCWAFIPGADEQEPIPYDPERAKRLLAEAGYPDGFSFKLYVWTQDPGQEMPILGEAVAGYWEKIGLKPEIQRIDYAAFKPTNATVKTKGIVWNHRHPYKVDEKRYLVQYMGYNSTIPYYQSEDLIPLLDKFAGMTDMKKRKALYKEIAQYMRSNYVNIPIVAAGSVWGYNGEKVEGKWPMQATGKPRGFVFMRHAKPLNTWRLFDPSDYYAHPHE